MAVIGADETLPPSELSLRRSSLAEQVAILLASDDFIGVGSLGQKSEAVRVVGPGSGGQAGQRPLVIEAVVDLGA